MKLFNKQQLGEKVKASQQHQKKTVVKIEFSTFKL